MELEENLGVFGIGHIEFYVVEAFLEVLPTFAEHLAACGYIEIDVSLVERCADSYHCLIFVVDLAATFGHP